MCTDFAVVSTDKDTGRTDLHVGRTEDMWYPFVSVFRTFPAGIHWKSEAPEGCKPIEWTSKYTFSGIVIEGMGKTLLIDGTSKTLSVALNSLKGTVYNKTEEGDQALSIRDIGSWILGNFATIDEVREGLKGVKVWGKYLEALKKIPGIHVALHEYIEGEEPKHAVIEFIKGKTKVIDNPIKVVTNDPKFSYHIANLRLENGFDPMAAGPKTYGTLTLPGNDLGSRMKIPGGDSSAERFIRVAVQINTAGKYVMTTKKAEAFTVDTIGRVFRSIGMNDLTIPVGDEKKVVHEYTQWAIVKNMADQVFRIKVYGEVNYTRQIHFSEIPEGGINLKELYA